MARTRFLRLGSTLAGAFIAFGCSGGIADLGGSTPSGSTSDANGSSPGDVRTPTDASVSVTEIPVPDAGTDAANECSYATHPGMIGPGGSMTPRPAGSALRLDLVFQGSRFAIVKAKGVDMVLPPSYGPLHAGVHAGYWAELRDASEGTLYTDHVPDPTRMEAVGPEGGFQNFTLPYCYEKQVHIDLPNDASGKTIVVFGSPYGTMQAAKELARFHLP